MAIKKKTLFAVTLLSLILIAVYVLRLDALGWYFWHAYKTDVSSQPALDLKNYQVEIDGMPIPEIEDASGLTYNSTRHTLFTVLNQEPLIIEIGLDGKVIRKIHVTGVDDMEGITHIDDNRYVIADERDNRLILVTLSDDAKEIDVTQAPKLKVGINPKGNKNFEGVSWDENNNRLLVVKERSPKFIMSIKGFFDAQLNQPLDVEIKKVEAFESAIQWSLRDLSSVTYHSPTNHLLLLSDESRLIKEYDKDGHAVGALALWKGFHGLKETVPQAEGIAVGADDRIYVMSEPNLFYVFKPKKL